MTTKKKPVTMTFEIDTEAIAKATNDAITKITAARPSDRKKLMKAIAAELQKTVKESIVTK